MLKLCRNVGGCREGHVVCTAGEEGGTDGGAVSVVAQGSVYTKGYSKISRKTAFHMHCGEARQAVYVKNVRGT